MTGAKTMIGGSEDAMSVQMSPKMCADDMLCQLTYNAGERHWSVVRRVISGAFLEYRSDPCLFPSCGQLPRSD